MKDKEWCKTIEAKINDLESRMNKLDGSTDCSNKKIVRIEIAWPEDYIGGLHFTARVTHAVFELKKDGNYYSDGILFNSARDTDEGTGRDLLSEYLDTDAVKQAMINALKEDGMEVDAISVFLPKENQGIKKYNGVKWWYWLKERVSGSSAYFTLVDSNGGSSAHNASSVGGCAPAFCVAKRHG
jgi:hypothetical protein